MTAALQCAVVGRGKCCGVRCHLPRPTQGAAGRQTCCSQHGQPGGQWRLLHLRFWRPLPHTSLSCLHTYAFPCKVYYTCSSYSTVRFANFQKSMAVLWCCCDCAALSLWQCSEWCCCMATEVHSISSVNALDVGSTPPLLSMPCRTETVLSTKTSTMLESNRTVGIHCYMRCVCCSWC